MAWERANLCGQINGTLSNNTNGPRAPSPDCVLKTARTRLLRVSFVNPLTNGHCAPISIQYVCYNNYIVTCRCAPRLHVPCTKGVRGSGCVFFHRQNRIVINYYYLLGKRSFCNHCILYVQRLHYMFTDNRKCIILLFATTLLLWLKIGVISPKTKHGKCKFYQYSLFDTNATNEKFYVELSLTCYQQYSNSLLDIWIFQRWDYIASLARFLNSLKNDSCCVLCLNKCRSGVHCLFSYVN